MSPSAPTERARSPRRRYISINDAAEYLGVTERTIRQMISDGRLIGYRNGAKFIRLDLNEIDERMVDFGGGVS
jgi:excisionase family DNA binding protein